MTPHFLTRILTHGLLALSTLLVSCGSSEIYNPFRPTRVVVFGDGFSLISATNPFTVNDTSTKNWASQIAASYGVTNIVNRAAGNALVSDVQTQVNTFGASYQAGDLVVISAGYRDLINDAMASTNNAAARGTDFANVVRSLVTNGAKHIAVTGVYDLSKVPAAGFQTNLAALTGSRGTLSAAFNDALKSNLGSGTLTNVGEYVRLLDLEAYLNTVRAAPATAGFLDTTTVVCNTSTANIGLGAARVDSSTCTTGTLAQAAYNSYVFADSVYPTPAFHRAWGASAHGQLVARW